jgi:hypothetical protein
VRPAGLGLLFAVAAGHGVIEPAVRRVRVAVDVVTLAVGASRRLRKALHVLDREGGRVPRLPPGPTISSALDAELAFYAVQVFRIGLTF